MPRRPRPKIDVFSEEEPELLMKRIDDSTYDFQGLFEELESA